MDRFRASRRRRALRAQAIAFLGGACRICGYHRCHEALDFHHLDPGEKDFQISRGLTNLAQMVPELQKCALLCSRCHREVHAGLHPQYIVVERDGADGGFFSED